MDANNKKQFRRVESNMGEMIEDFNKRFDVMDANNKKQFGRIESNMGEMIEDFNKRFDAADTKFDKLDKKVDVLLFLSISLRVYQVSIAVTTIYVCIFKCVMYV